MCVLCVYDPTANESILIKDMKFYLKRTKYRLSNSELRKAR